MLATLAVFLILQLGTHTGRARDAHCSVLFILNAYAVSILGCISIPGTRYGRA